jgi:hypothetical protein
MHRSRALILISLLCVATVHAAEGPWSISPSSGPASGNVLVTLKGNFGTWPYGIIFGGVSVPATRVDEHTLTTTLPAHPPGTVDVSVFEYDIGIPTDLTFTFTQAGADRFERVLLPLGSEFHTELRVWNVAEPGSGYLSIFGGEYSFSSGSDPVALVLAGSVDLLERSASNYSGNPGRFLYILKDQLALFGANLRVFDITRDAQSFGTEIPIVRERQFDNAPIAFPSVPIDSRFRTTLRIYSTEARAVTVTIGDQPFEVALQPGRDAYEPAYASFTNFPTSGTGAIRVKVDAPPLFLSPVVLGPPIWAMLTITNNDTQQITTMTPPR